MEPLPVFPIFPDPVREGVIEQSTAVCDVCGLARGLMYKGPQYSPSTATDDLQICPWCIGDGSAAACGVTFNDSTIYPAFHSTPQMNAEDRDLVEHRTPGFTTWQGNHWLICCGRACVYLGEADAADLRGRWAGAVPSMFDGLDLPQQQADYIVKKIRRGADPCAYVFQCHVCGGLRAYWDCD